MSVSHPYLKQLKVHVLRFCEHRGPIKDDHPSLLPFCRTLEDIIQDGLRGVGTRLSNVVRKTYWEWLSILPKAFTSNIMGSPLIMAIEYARDDKKAIYGTGKGRLMIRSMLNKGLLTKAFKTLRDRKEILYDYYDQISILGDDILSELLMSMLLPLEQSVSFQLNIRNCSFLDETWELPWFRRFEMVPCKRLGVDLHVIQGRVIVCEIEPGSVADEDMKIEAGDIIDDLFGESLRVGSLRKVMGLMEDFSGAPIYISLIKCLDREGRFYRPVMPYLEAATLCKQALVANRARRLRELSEHGTEWDTQDISISSQQNHSESAPNAASNSNPGESAEKLVEVTGVEEDPILSDKSSPGASANSFMTESGLHKCFFWGFVNVGRVGTVEQIENGVVSVVKRGEDHKRPVLLEMGETDLTIYCANSKTVICKI